MFVELGIMCYYFAPFLRNSSSSSAWISASILAPLEGSLPWLRAWAVVRGWVSQLYEGWFGDGFCEIDGLRGEDVCVVDYIIEGSEWTHGKGGIFLGLGRLFAYGFGLVLALENGKHTLVDIIVFFAMAIERMMRPNVPVLPSRAYLRCSAHPLLTTWIRMFFLAPHSPPSEIAKMEHAIRLNRTGVVRFMTVHLAFVVALCMLDFRVFGVALIAGFVHRRLANG